MGRKEELMEETNESLKAYLAESGLPTYGNKEELVNRVLLFETGVEPVPNEEVAEPESDVEDTPPEAVEEVDSDAVEDAESEGDSSLVLVKYTGTSPHKEERGRVFSAKHPFVAVPPDEAERLVVGNARHYRTATRSEIEQYYG